MKQTDTYSMVINMFLSIISHKNNTVYTWQSQWFNVNEDLKHWQNIGLNIGLNIGQDNISVNRCYSSFRITKKSRRNLIMLHKFFNLNRFKYRTTHWYVVSRERVKLTVRRYYHAFLWMSRHFIYTDIWICLITKDYFSKEPHASATYPLINYDLMSLYCWSHVYWIWLQNKHIINQPNIILWIILRIY